MRSSRKDTGLSAAEVEAAAAEWVCRVDEQASPEEWAALDVWLAASSRHRAAFLRLSTAWRRANELKRLEVDGGIDSNFLIASSWRAERLHDSSASLERAPRSKAPNTFRLAASIAAFAVLAVGAVSWWFTVERTSVDVYSTRIGEFHRMPLSDGSTVALNTGSEVRVRYTNTIRHIELVRGEALFEVAKNSDMPFEVEAGGTTVRAVGTKFSVRLRDEGAFERVDVLVAEGRVAINPPSPRTYAAGSFATVLNRRVQATTLDIEDIRNKLAWTTGRLVFQGEKLSAVVEEINRYNSRKLLVADPGIAGLRIGGIFQATDPDGFARALDHTFGIKSHLARRPLDSDVIRLDSVLP